MAERTLERTSERKSESAPHHLSAVRRIAAKELTVFFASPTAYLFLASFAAVTLFVFFWGEAFFARNTADIRPLFEWMPVLLIFLASALTMRLWSEERRTGTLEFVHTQPVPLWCFVLGKFAACLALLLVALVVTLPLPLTVSFLGDLDWGPVGAGYLATVLLGAAYLAIGLFVSARSDNPIVSLITATALCGVFYLVGTSTLTDLVGTRAGEWLRLLGTGSRFDAITRGVVDLRDLYYYFSLIAVFLTLNTLVLERERWASRGGKPRRHRAVLWLALLLAANALAANLWLGQVRSLRADVTEGHQYSISDTTRNYLAQLREPLLIRGYFSGKTHPLLAPLVPQLEDLIREYAVAGGERVRVEWVDPAQSPAQEEEANSKYGIQPVPFQVADRYQSAIVSSYFHVLVQYGDQHEVLDFRDLVEIRASSESDVEVQLRNPEYDLTRAIKTVLSNYQSGGNLFDTVTGQLTFAGYVSPDAQLPEGLRALRASMDTVLADYTTQAKGRLTTQFIDPDADGGKVAQQIAQDYGFQPLAASLMSEQHFYFYLTLTDGKTIVQLPVDDLTEAGFRRSFDAGIKRFAGGFTRTVALVAPKPDPMMAQYGVGGPMFQQLRELLGSDVNIVDEVLTDGHVAAEADALLLLAPALTDDRERFAVDQFLMQGGTVIAATGPYQASFMGRGIDVAAHDSGLTDWLAHNGLNLEQTMVLDPHSGAFPLPVTRTVGATQLQEIRMLDYPYFIDIRSDGMDRDHPVTADLPQLTMAWAAPITVTAEARAARSVTELLHSSPDSWRSASTEVLPMLDSVDSPVFKPEGERGAQVLGVAMAGRFDSFWAGKPSPLLDDGAGERKAAAGQPGGNPADPAAEPVAQSAGQPPGENAPAFGGVIEHSPESARIVLFSSNDFLKDPVVGMAGLATGSAYLNSLQLIANTVDWALADSSLLEIRTRGHYNRTLPAMQRDEQSFWEYLNYVLAALALGVIALLWRHHIGRRQRQFLEYV